MPRPAPLSTALMLTLAGAAAAPTTAPSNAQLRQWFARLADTDSAVRADARQDLMALARDDLPRLLAVATAGDSVRRQQVDDLHEVVRQVWLAGGAFEAVNVPAHVGSLPYHPYCLGLSWQRGVAGNYHPDGVPVGERWPGSPPGEGFVTATGFSEPTSKAVETSTRDPWQIGASTSSPSTTSETRSPTRASGASRCQSCGTATKSGCRSRRFHCRLPSA